VTINPQNRDHTEKRVGTIARVSDIGKNSLCLEWKKKIPNKKNGGRGATAAGFE